MATEAAAAPPRPPSGAEATLRLAWQVFHGHPPGTAALDLAVMAAQKRATERRRAERVVPIKRGKKKWDAPAKNRTWARGLGNRRSARRVVGAGGMRTSLAYGALREVDECLCLLHHGVEVLAANALNPVIRLVFKRQKPAEGLRRLIAGGLDLSK
jgi:hypothetical protein